MTYEFLPILPPDACETDLVRMHGIDFRPIPTEQGYRNLQPGTYEVRKEFTRLMLLGMATDQPEGSEWWGPWAREYDFTRRVFIGNRVGRIFLNYTDGTQDVIPVIFGVNCWFYELMYPLKEGEEKYLNNYGGPYPEPFASDPEVKKLLDESRILLENDAPKGLKFIFSITPASKVIEEIEFASETFHRCGFQVTAITGLTGEAELPEEWKGYDAGYFLRQEYYPAADRLARRLYTFRDEFPRSVALQLPDGYKGPEVRFTGNVYADIFTNVYLHNVWDMATDKVDSAGGMHTSSKNAPNFGLYVGFGTYQDNAGSYYGHIWTRDVGRSLMEVVAWGEKDRVRKAAEQAFHYLYDRSTRFKQPNWKRIANASELGDERLLDKVSGKENDGHASMMLFIYRLCQHLCVDRQWIVANWKHMKDAAEWFCWQMENPEISHFNRVLHSESEASSQKRGNYDLFSNTLAYYALKSFSRIAGTLDKESEKDRWNSFADLLYAGIMDVFTTIHPRYGRIFVDCNWGGWTWEYKRFALLFAAPDFTTYDLISEDIELYEICLATYQAQKEDCFSYDAGRQMGYGQGYLTETAILLDNYADLTGCIEQAAAFCWHAHYHPWIVPEGVISHPSGKFWFRNADLGNSVQQAEIVKCARLLVGLDDLNPQRGLKVIPRLPNSWYSIQVRDYPVIATSEDKEQQIQFDLTYKRIDSGYSVSMKAARPIDRVSVRVGPFDGSVENIRLHGTEAQAHVVTIQDSQFMFVDLQNVGEIKFDVTGS